MTANDLRVRVAICLKRHVITVTFFFKDSSGSVSRFAVRRDYIGFDAQFTAPVGRV